jgi:DNA-binding NarL/FixJ family response regulator
MTTATPITVVLADDHPVVLDGLRALISGCEDMDVVATATDGNAAVEAVLSSKPAVAVMDVRMPGCDGIEATRRILESEAGVRVIVLSAMQEPSVAAQALRAGAIGFLSKEAIGQYLIDGIRQAAEGKAVVTAELVTRIMQDSSSFSSQSPLSRRDEHIVRLIADGHTNEQIARTLEISVAMVKMHLSGLFERVGAKDRASALAICFRQGWID